METKETMKIQERETYVPAKLTVIEVSAQNVICQSGGNKWMGEQSLSESNFEDVK